MKKVFILYVLMMLLLVSSCSGKNSEEQQPEKTDSVEASANETSKQDPVVEDKSAKPEQASESEGEYKPNVPVQYFQFDERWATEHYGGDSPKDTIRRWACGPADMAMVVATLKDPKVTPLEASAWALEHGYSTDAPGHTKDGFFADYGKKFGIDVTQIYDGDLRGLKKEKANAYHEEAYNAVKDGNWVIAFMGKGPWTTEAHFVLWYGLAGDNLEDVLIMDSNSKKPEKARNKFELFKQTVVRYWVVSTNDKNAGS